MTDPVLERTLHEEICRIPLLDPHSHINPHSPAARNLDELLGYHYYTELAHSAGMDHHGPLHPDSPPQERVRAILQSMNRFDNTVQYSWFLEIAQTYLGFAGDRLTAADAEGLWSAAERQMQRPDWEQHVLQTTKVEQIFLTNDFDDRLEGFDRQLYVPCLRTDDLVFHFDEQAVRTRLSQATGIEVGSVPDLQRALSRLFSHFAQHGAKACAISLPPDFVPAASPSAVNWPPLPGHVFWMLAEQCRDFGLPFDLMIGVTRKVYRQGVFQGQDLFDQRTSLLQYRELFNAFPDVTFCVSVLTSNQNQELASYSWIFPNVVTSGHWWYANIPAFIEHDCRARLQAVPKNKQIGYYSDAYKLEFILPKYNMYRRILARILARDFVIDRRWSETQAIDLARLLLRDNARAIFGIGARPN
jgi:glucuronate isomerase